jgi:DNA polymerase-3 subunit gamma/tau
MHRDGADPVIVIQDLLEVTHWLTRVKIAPALAEEPGVPEEERVRGAAMSQALTMPVLTRCWQMLLKGLDETRTAPAPLAAAEMLLIRMTHAADLPPPAELVKSLRDDPPVQASTPRSGAAPAVPSTAPADAARPPSSAATALAPQRAAEPMAVVSADAGQTLRRYEDVVALFERKREGIMTAHLRQDVHLVNFSRPRIEFRPGPNAPRDLANRMGRLLSDWTGERWIVIVSDAEGAPTLAEQRAAVAAERLAAAERDPLVRAVKEAFPGAKVRGVTDRSKPASDNNQKIGET